VIGSLTYNVTVTLGAGALSQPLTITNPNLLREPWVLMLAALPVVVALRWRHQELRIRRDHPARVHPVFIAYVILSRTMVEPLVFNPPLLPGCRRQL
jgi:hypothetical protein